jgi:two-component system, chemotaxis family, sensor kinase CheA
MADELMDAFVEDSKEHLESIESDILALESMGGDFDEELVNRIFRTAHSIKGAAGFLGLTAIGSLAHKLENALHLLRDGQLTSEGPVCQILLQGFDMLRVMIDAPEESENLDISSVLEDVKGLLSAESQIRAETTLSLAATDGHHVFDVDMLTLEQALKGGKFLYHIEFDLIHDIHRQDKTPYEIIKTLQDSGLILDCRLDTEAVGNLEMGMANMIPMNVLYASIIDPDIVGMLLNVSSEKIRELDKALFQRQPGPSDAEHDPALSPSPTVTESPDMPSALRVESGVAVVDIDEKPDPAQAAGLHQALLEAVRLSPHVRLNLDTTLEVDASFAQLAAATYQSCARRGGSFGFLHPPGDSVAKSLRNMGLSWLLGGSA